MRTLSAASALWGLTLLGLGPQAAWGHTFPHRAEPRVGATVAASPACIHLWFDTALDPSWSTLRVQNGSGQPVDKGDGHVDPSDATLLKVSLPPLAPGTYRILWSVVDGDGHQTQGDYTFTIRREHSYHEPASQ